MILAVQELIQTYLIEVLFLSDLMTNMGYTRKEIEDSLSQNKYDDITATYLLLGRRTSEVFYMFYIVSYFVLSCFLFKNIFIH